MQRTWPEPPGAPARHYAGVLVTADPNRFGEVRSVLEALAGVEIHHPDPASGRCVAVLVTEDLAGNERLFAEIGRVDGVRSADLVYHLVDREDDDVAFLEPET